MESPDEVQVIDAPSSPSLLQRVARGDPLAARECIDVYGGLVWSLVRQRCESEADAEDAVQDIFLEIWKKAPTYHPELGSEVTFVALIARRRLIDGYRRQSRRLQAESMPTTDLPAPPATDWVELNDEARKARAALACLSDAQQKVLRLAILEGMTYPQIAELLDWPLGTVKTHARRGLQRLRQIMNAEESTEGEP